METGLLEEVLHDQLSSFLVENFRLPSCWLGQLLVDTWSKINLSYLAHALWSLPA